MPLTIWHLCSNRWNSAITEYAVSAARALAMAGHQTRFIAKLGTPAARRAAAYVPVLPVADFNWRGWRQLRDAARQAPPDIIVTYGGPETFLVRCLRSLASAKVLRFQGQSLVDRTLQASRHRFAHQHVDVLLTPSDSLAAAVQSLQPRQPVISVPLGRDTTIFRRVEGLAGSPQRPELLVFGRLDPVKGHEAMIGLFAALLASWDRTSPPPYLHIVGEPANLSVAELQAAVLAKGLVWGQDVVVTARRVDQVAATLSRASLGVVPSLGSELICRVAEEFLLCGTPVAVSGVGSLNEVLFPNAGFSFGGMSPEQSLAVFRHWLKVSEQEGPEAKSQRAEAARQRFSLEAMSSRLVDVLGQL